MKPLQLSDPAQLLPDLAAPRGGTDDFWARQRVRLCYLWRHGRLPRLDQPVRFTEWVQWRKLNDRDARKPPLVDKVRVKHHVAALLGDEWITPTLYYGAALPAQPEWPRPFVVKARHGCRQHVFVRDDEVDWEDVQRRARGWTRGPYGVWLDEWIYRHVPLGVIVEPFIGTDGVLPVDYKVHVFGGRTACVQVDQSREHGHQRAFFDTEWNCLWASSGYRLGAPPQSLSEMLSAAEWLGADFDFVRCDLYEIGGRPRFGELSFYPASGLKRLHDALDHWLGQLWAEARGPTH